MRFSFGRIVSLWVLLASGLPNVFAVDGSSGAKSTAERPALLNEAFNAFLEHQGRWAFTETHAGVDLKGKPSGETVFRIDPSLPYAEQFRPLKYSGHSPTEQQLKQAAEHGERSAKRRQQQGEEAKTKPLDEEFHLNINGQKVTPELERAVILAEDETGITYEVPMRKDGGSGDALFDKFQLTARVSKERHEFERVTIRQRSAMRVKLIAKLSEGLIEIEFGSADPHYPAMPMKISQQATIAILFGKAHTVHDQGVRSDVKHVTPYDERFGVKVGPMRTIEL